MEIDQFIDELRSSGIHLDIHGDKLKVSSENDKIAENTIAKIKEHKDVLLNYLTKYQGAGVKSEVQIPRLETSDSYVLSSGQHRLWLLSQFDDGSIAYNYTDTYRIEGSLDRELLAQSFARLLARHEILRTTFGKNAEGEIRQFVHAPLAMQVPIEFRDARNNRRPRALASELAEKAAIEAFELTTGPLIRLLLVQTDQEEFFFTYVIHHIVSDGWSMVVLIRELFAHYMDLVEGKESSLAPLRIQYKDFASWQQQQLSGDQLKSQQQFWQQQFEGDLPILNLPTDHARPAIKTFNGRSAHSELDASLTQPFHALLKEEGCSLFMGVLALTKTLLYKYTGQSDIIVGSPTAGRNHSDLEEQLGFYVNTLALRTRFDEQSSFRELLGLVKKNALACFDHQSYPFDRLVEELALEKDRSRNPLFDVMVIVQNTNVNSAGEAEAFGDIQISYEEKEGNTSLVDLSLEYAESPNGLYLKIEYNTDLFKRETIQRMGQHLRLLLRAIVSQPNQAICQLTCISEQERELLLNGFNDTQTDYRKDLTILDLLAKQVERIPNNTAVTFEDRSLTFQQLDELSNQLAAYLQKYYHVERNDMVALKLDRSEWMLVSIVGVLKAGGAYVPIGTDYPQDRITYIREESEFKVCIDKAELGRFLRMRNDLPTVAIQHRVQPSDYAYAIYTSGSTGRPKGVLNDQAGLFNRLMWMRDDLDITDKDVLIQKTPYTFDVSVWELVMPLVTGSRLVFARPEGHKDPLYLQDLIRREQVSIMHFVPSMLGAFLFELDASACASLRHVVCSGEALPQRMVESFREQIHNSRIHNYYGPTEAAIDVTAIDLTEVNFQQRGVTIGRPVANTAIYIVDRHFQLQPVGVPGELLIGGIQVARGYLKRPDLTADRFVDNPFGEGRVYKTGDLVKWLPDGSIHYIGRIDNQIKIRGNRVELGEIESVLQQFELVKECAVLVKEDKSGNKRLIGYMQLNEACDHETIKDHLKEKLPEYMIPTFLIEMEEFPLTGSGKLNRKALPEPNVAEFLTNEYVAPRNEREEQLATIWQQEFEVERVGVHDGFFQLGGDSIRAIRVLSKINKLLQVRLVMADIYDHPTIELLLQKIEEDDGYLVDAQVREEVEKELQSIAQEVADQPEIEDAYPMSDIEMGMLYANSRNQADGMYHDQFVFPIAIRNFDMKLFHQAINRMIQKHETLRIAYNFSDYSRPLRLVYKEIVPDVSYVDIRDMERSQQHEEVRAYMQKERSERPFDTERPGLWRMRMYATSDNRQSFVFQFHHAIIDGWSRAMLMMELNNTYYELLQNPSYHPPKLPLSYRDYVVDQECLKKDQKTYEYWQNQLNEYKRLDIFTDEFEIEEFTHTIEGETYRQIKAYCDANQVTIRSLNLAAYLYTLKMLSYENDILGGVVVNGRPIAEGGDKIIGCFLNTLPFRHRIEDQTLGQFVSQIEGHVRQEKKYEGLSLLEMSKMYADERASDNPFFDTLFNYVDFRIYKQVKMDDHRDTAEDEVDQMYFELLNTFLDVHVMTIDLGYHMMWYRSRKLKSGITNEKMYQFHMSFIRELLLDADQKVNDIGIMTLEENYQFLESYNDTFVEYPTGKSMLELFEDQLAKTPDNIGLIYNGRSFTYRELSDLTNRLAGRLIKAGIKRGMPVPLVSHKCDAQVWGVLAVLKAGGYYVPIKGDLPAGRIADLLTQVEASVVLVQDDYWDKVKDQPGREKIILSEENFANESTDVASVPVEETDLAYIIFTSGSTGKPKGVMIDHRGAVNTLYDMNARFDIGETDRVFGISDLNFDLSVYDIFGILACGGCLVLPLEEERQNPAAWLKYVQEEGVTLWNSVPQIAGLLADAAEEEKVMLSSIRQFWMSGDWIPLTLPDRLRALNPDVEPISLGGATEGSIWSIHYPIGEIQQQWNSIPYGMPLGNQEMYVLSDQLDPCPYNLTGNVYIGGKGLAKGYFKDPEKTADSFIFHKRLNRMLYKTGDLGAFHKDGYIIFQGRNDGQVKIRGFRIELGEIEYHLQSQEFIQDAIVLAKSLQTGGKELVAYAVVKEGFDMLASFEHLQENLPDYMVPVLIVELKEFPLTVNGKVDRSALPEPDLSEFMAKQFVAPRNEVEEQLAELWKDVLQLEKVGVKDNFFFIGGDSIVSIRLISRINKAFAFNLKIGQLYEHNTIEDLAKLMEINAEASKEEAAARSEVEDSLEMLKEEIFGDL